MQNCEYWISVRDECRLHTIRTCSFAEVGQEKFVPEQRVDVLWYSTGHPGWSWEDNQGQRKFAAARAVGKARVKLNSGKVLFSPK